MLVSPRPGRFPVETGHAELLADADRPGGWLLRVNGADQSYVDLTDPTHLEFEYVRWVGDVIDEFRPAGDPVRAVHLGGGAATLPRYIRATRPGSVQIVVERDPALADLAVDELDLRPDDRLELVVGDAREHLATVPDGTVDLVVVDAFIRLDVPRHLTTAEFVADVARVLRPDGVHVTNLMDRIPLALSRSFVATLRGAFPYLLLLAEPAVLRGRRRDNVVLVASRAPLPVEVLSRRAAGAPRPWRVYDRDVLAGFSADSPAITDDAPGDLDC